MKRTLALVVAVTASWSSASMAADWQQTLSSVLSEQQASSETHHTTTQDNLVNILTSRLGVSTQQAEGGTGAILKAAKDNMTADKFSQLLDVIPNSSDMLATVTNATSNTGDNDHGLLGKASALLGKKDNNTSDSLSSLVNSFSSLGMDKGMVSQFLPIVLDYVKQHGSSALMNSLKSAIL